MKVNAQFGSSPLKKESVLSWRLARKRWFNPLSPLVNPPYPQRKAELAIIAEADDIAVDAAVGLVASHSSIFILAMVEGVGMMSPVRMAKSRFTSVWPDAKKYTTIRMDRAMRPIRISFIFR